MQEPIISLNIEFKASTQIDLVKVCSIYNRSAEQISEARIRFNNLYLTFDDGFQATYNIEVSDDSLYRIPEYVFIECDGTHPDWLCATSVVGADFNKEHIVSLKR